MTETHNARRRSLMDRARGLARTGQVMPAPGLIRGDLISLPYEDLLDMLIELLHVCPIDAMEVPPAAEMIPCGGCGDAIPVTRARNRYCSAECKRRAASQRAMDGRAAA